VRRNKLTRQQWYRHSACLIKHRWQVGLAGLRFAVHGLTSGASQHTDYWQHASALQMTKHQTVMLLETAAILTSGSSLPDEKSFWPAAVSPPSSGLLGCETLNTTTLSRSSQYGSFSAASSIPTIPSKLNSQSGSTDSENATDEADELDEEDSGAREEDMFVMEEMDAGAGMDLDEEQAMPPPSVVVKGRTANGPAAVPAQSLFKLQRSSVPLLPPTHYSQSAPSTFTDLSPRTSADSPAALGFFASRPSQDAIIIESQPLTHASGFDTEMAC
jgi:hypothetical protein